MDVFNHKQFANKEELFTFIKENKDTLIAQKKAVFKEADGFMGDITIEHKANKVDNNEGDVLSKSPIINTTNILDSHGDVHVKGIWDRSLSNDSNKLLLQEHKRGFDDVIAAKADVNAYVLDTTFKALGYDIEGKTQALIFDANIKKDKNPKMFERYKSGEVDNHSVGMQYVKIVMAVNSEESWASAEKEVWDKYIKIVANKSDAEERGYFWAVKEAKVIEGSAVTIGSNPITGMYKSDPSKGTRENNMESSNDTLNKEDLINAFKNYKND